MTMSVMMGAIVAFPTKVGCKHNGFYAESSGYHRLKIGTHSLRLVVKLTGKSLKGHYFRKLARNCQEHKYEAELSYTLTKDTVTFHPGKLILASKAGKKYKRHFSELSAEAMNVEINYETVIYKDV